VYGKEERFIQQVEGHLSGQGRGALGDREPRICHHEGRGEGLAHSEHHGGSAEGVGQRWLDPGLGFC
jgi:hypothetical protein